MNFFKKLSVKLIPVFLLALCTVSGIWGISVQKTQIPQEFISDKSSYSQKRDDNPETDTADFTLKKAHTSENSINEKNTNQSDKKEKSAKNEKKSSEPSTEASDKELSSESAERSIINYFARQNVITSESGTYSGLQENINFSHETKEINQKTEAVYFTTTIKDKETVKSKSYRFEIHHINNELKVRKESISINDGKAEQFKGKVLLEEGKNSIRVYAEYTDKSGKKISVHSDYTVYVNLGDIVIVTTLKNGSSVNENQISFEAYALLDSQRFSVSADCNGKAIEPISGKYIAVLSSGDNKINILAQKNGKIKTEEFLIKCSAGGELGIYTDLKNSEVNESQYSFTAKVLNGTENARISVVLNGKTIISDNQIYTVNLNIGINSIRIKVSDSSENGEKKVINEVYEVRYVPLSTSETAPKLSYCNVSDGINVKGNTFTLNIKPEDFNGNRIYYDKIKVSLNGTVYPYSWVSEYTSYILYLNSGANTLNIRIYDNDGRYSDYMYTINCTYAADGEKIGLFTLNIDANVLGIGDIVKNASVDIRQGENTAGAVVRFLEENGYGFSNGGSIEQGFYLSEISKQGIAANVNIPAELRRLIDNDRLVWTNQSSTDSIGESDYCQGSGWMFSVNDIFSGTSLSDVILNNGDILKLRFTLAYGKDIGGYAVSSDGTRQNYEKIW